VVDQALQSLAACGCPTQASAQPQCGCPASLAQCLSQSCAYSRAHGGSKVVGHISRANWGGSHNSRASVIVIGIGTPQVSGHHSSAAHIGVVARIVATVVTTVPGPAFPAPIDGVPAILAIDAGPAPVPPAACRTDMGGGTVASSSRGGSSSSSSSDSSSSSSDSSSGSRLGGVV
jgi:hypothetical protein